MKEESRLQVFDKPVSQCVSNKKRFLIDLSNIIALICVWKLCADGHYICT